ncbi:MAG: hypothetical protein KGS61_22110, partial [Verrucomicrobia bacterium]|nr:hypothetical protein [Verrucomicrobiota bacterium]
EIVSQYAQNDRRVLPPSGLPLGNIQTGFSTTLYYYGPELSELCYPQDGATNAPYPFYDRWGDSYNVSTEFVILNQGRSLANLAYLATLTSSSTQAWTSVGAQIPVPTNTVPLNVPLTLTLQPPAGLDLTNARVVWEARDQEPVYGTNFTFAPVCAGTQWVEVEATWPDGRRVFGTNQFWADSPVVDWVDDCLPKAAVLDADGGDGWKWMTNDPTPYSGALAHQSTLSSGLHEHYFAGATTSMAVSAGNVLFAYVYLDPTNIPSELMLQWNDGVSWEHRAYWGANDITYGSAGTASRYYAGPLPPAGQWAQLAVPAAAVGLEGSVVSGMAFSLYNGRATWDYAGKAASISTSIADTSPPNVAITAPAAGATVAGVAVMTIASATDDIAVAGVQFQLDGANLGSVLTNAPYTLVWNTVTVPNGTHALTAIATDMAGNSTTASPVSMVVSNVTSATTLSADTTPPVVAITAPLAGATVSGSAITVSATATDDVSVASVQFQLDGVNLGSPLTAAPYVVAWDSTTATNGAHSLTAVATDPAGNSA